jgi:hypothetical protein
VIAGNRIVFLETSRGGRAGFARGPAHPYRSREVLEKKFLRNFGNFRISGFTVAARALVGGGDCICDLLGPGQRLESHGRLAGNVRTIQKGPAEERRDIVRAGEQHSCAPWVA